MVERERGREGKGPSTPPVHPAAPAPAMTHSVLYHHSVLPLYSVLPLGFTPANSDNHHDSTQPDCTFHLSPIARLHPTTQPLLSSITVTESNDAFSGSRAACPTCLSPKPVNSQQAARVTLSPLRIRSARLFHRRSSSSRTRPPERRVARQVRDHRYSQRREDSNLRSPSTRRARSSGRWMRMQRLRSSACRIHMAVAANRALHT